MRGRVTGKEAELRDESGGRWRCRLGTIPRLAAGFAAIAALSMIAACGDDDGESLTVYSGREEELVAPLFERYQDETGNEVNIRYGDTAELAATLIEEGENSPADVFFGQDAGALGALEKEGLLAELPDRPLSQVDERFRSRQGRWVGTSGRARVVAYNTDKLSQSDLPTSVLGLTDPEWRGRIGWAPTNGSFQAFITAMRLTEGEQATEDWLRGIAENDPQVFEDNEQIRDAIAAGEIDVGLINHYYVAQAREEEGADYPVGVYFPRGGDVGSLINVAGAGVLESGDDPERATGLIEFLLSEDSQRFFSEETKEYPLVEGIPADRGVKPLEQIEQPPIQLGDLDDLRGTLELIERSGAL
jgi:iron(III) transport system substrate-binding protein